MNRRGFLGVLAGAIAAPTIVRAGVLMPVRASLQPLPEWIVPNGQWLSRASYPELFAVVGTVYGGRPGQFRLPIAKGWAENNMIIKANNGPLYPAGMIVERYPRPEVRNNGIR